MLHNAQCALYLTLSIYGIGIIDATISDHGPCDGTTLV
jgi:hypothetical protein